MDEQIPLINIVNKNERELNTTELTNITGRKYGITVGKTVEAPIKKMLADLKRHSFDDGSKAKYTYYVEDGYRSLKKQQGKFISGILNIICKQMEDYDLHTDKENKIIIKLKNGYKESLISKLNSIRNGGKKTYSYKDCLDQKTEIQFWDKWFTEWYDEWIKNKYSKNISLRDATEAAYDYVLNQLLDIGLLTEEQCDLFKSQKESKKLFDDLTIMLAGYSEHESGLAFDIQVFAGRKEIFLNENNNIDYLCEIAAQNGFILRYPKDKDKNVPKKIITGVKTEVWHFRYVGSPEIAKEIMTNGLTLEEYVIAQNIISKFNNNKDLTPEVISNYIDDLIMSDSSNIFDDIVGTVAKKQIRDNKLLLDDLKNYLKGKLVKNNSNEIQKNAQDSQGLIQRPPFEPHSYPTYDNGDGKHI